uniref:Ig-like domain-containing protein n=1 Tax=Parascaris equorum TaxID=6256 RepID=A0A914RK28_PAREQ
MRSERSERWFNDLKINAFQNFTLIINRVEPYDTAAYVCSITSPEMSITHHLQVNVHPSVLISPDTSPLLVGVGENVIIKCSASGNPAPKVSWSKQDGQLRLKHVTLADSGIYECIASNNVGADAHDTIEVRVQCNRSPVLE